MTPQEQFDQAIALGTSLQQMLVHIKQEAARIGKSVEDAILCSIHLDTRLERALGEAKECRAAYQFVLDKAMDDTIP